MNEDESIENSWTSEPWTTGREDMQSYRGDTGEPFSSIYRRDDERMEIVPDGLGGMSRLPLRIAYVDGKDIPREEEKANARRIAACVNACGGYSFVEGKWVKTHLPLKDPSAEIQQMRSRKSSDALGLEMAKNVLLEEAISFAISLIDPEGPNAENLTLALERLTKAIAFNKE